MEVIADIPMMAQTPRPKYLNRWFFSRAMTLLRNLFGAARSRCDYTS
jgi:hypothetical protein